MDPLSITTGCFTLVKTIGTLTVQINGFVREVRGARSDLDAVSRELLSLTTVLDMLAYDAGDTARSAFPPSLAQQVAGIVKNCGGVVSQIKALLEKYGGESARLKKGVQWSWGGKSDIEQLRSSLEAHKSALDIALQMVEMSIMRDIKADTQQIRDDTAAIPGIKEDTTQILVEIARLQAKLPKNAGLQGLDGHSSSGFMLQRYLDNLTTYAETAYDASDGELEEETAPSTPRAAAEQGEIEHHLEHSDTLYESTDDATNAKTGETSKKKGGFQYDGVSHVGWMRKQRTRLLRHEWEDHHCRLIGTQLAMHPNELPSSSALNTIDVDDYAVACSPIDSNRLSAKLQALKLTSGSKENNPTAFSFQLVPTGPVWGGRRAAGRATAGGGAHHFAVKTRDERIDWMRELMLAKALKVKGDGYEVNVNGNAV